MKRCLVAFLLFCGPLVAGAEPITVAIYDHSDGSSKGPKNLAAILTPEAGFACERVSPQAIRDGALDGRDVVIVPGGSGSKQSKMLEGAGLDKIRGFVEAGGGYVGICAGSYLASSEYDWSLRLINTRVLDRKHWARGTGMVTLALSERGKQLLAADADKIDVYYGQGPLLALAIEPGLPAYEPLALYDTEIAKKGAPEGVMRGTTAIASAPYGEGRVICFSPHPEKAAGPNGLILAGVRWAANEP
ncbi:hypothetical protein Mal64_25360 [Pseudobythopirellula maris]|uniref:Biotin-protein ligase N-terminal domain-containing protein n=1 Tax=Pseudobythopirellula maris TaxID=2527991 RepID=A0A5C5ZNE9_9BACT|nr:BPL-N domain-containing protein [Pseudobythopirellula maris]TWT89044.1 hypothetical protein Mal64_25360 [Pseudobythopirellula maris]